MTPFASVAMLEKLALLKIASCNALVLSCASGGRTAEMISRGPATNRPASGDVGSGGFMDFARVGGSRSEQARLVAAALARSRPRVGLARHRFPATAIVESTARFAASSK